jgi:hypothetical protein
MTKGAISACSTKVRRAVDLVMQSPGMLTNAFPAALGISESWALKVLQCARRDGKIRPVRVATKEFGWFPVGRLADMAERRWKAIAKDRAQDRNRAKKARAANQSPEELERLYKEFPLEVVQRWVSAQKPLPFKCVAPASVFHLGGML